MPTYGTTTGYQRPVDRLRCETHHARTGGSGSQFLEVPRPFPPFTDIPQPPETAMQDVAGRRRFADLIRRAGTFLDPDPNYVQGRYRTYPRIPGEDLLSPTLAAHENDFYGARRAGHSSSQISVIIPGSSNPYSGANADASGSQTPVASSQTPRPDITHHARTGSSGSQFLEVPRPIPPFTAIVTNTTDTEQQPSSKPSTG